MIIRRGTASMHGHIKPAVKEKKEKPTCENQTSEVK
jgi:hypothetical protein